MGEEEMKTNQDRAEEIIREALLTAPRNRGMDDTVSPHIAKAAEIIAGETREFGRSMNRAYDRALLAARKLSDAGLLAEDLPAKDEWDEVILIPREGKTTVIKDVFTDTSYSIDGARRHALDMLAAAAHAEKDAQ